MTDPFIPRPVAVTGISRSEEGIFLRVVTLTPFSGAVTAAAERGVGELPSEGTALPVVAMNPDLSVFELWPNSVVGLS